MKKKPFKITINERQLDGKIARTSYELDGLLLLGADDEKKSITTHIQGKIPQLVMADKAISAVCRGLTVEIIRDIRGYLLMTFDSLIDRARMQRFSNPPGVDPVEEAAPAPLDLHEGEENDNQ